jgi:hypothetical protein
MRRNGEPGSSLKQVAPSRCGIDPGKRKTCRKFFEEYMPNFCKPESKVKFFFDVYDVEEWVL